MENSVLEENINPYDDPEILVKFRESSEGKRLVSWVLSESNKCESARSQEKLRWYRNLALYEGKEEAKIGAVESPADGRLYSPVSGRRKKRIKINRIKPIVRTEIARLTAQKPTSSAIPASSEEQDLGAAQVAEAILQSQYDRRLLLKEYADTAFWMSITGNGFIKDYWDTQAYDRWSAINGDIIYANVSPFNVLVPDLRLKDIEQQPYVIHMYSKPMEWIYIFFKSRLAGAALSPTAHSATTIMDEAYYKLQGTKESVPDACMVREIWIKPGATRLMPAGGLITMVDSIIVQLDDRGIPYQHGEFPFTHFTHIPSASFYASSVVTDLEDLQLEYSSLRNQVSESRVKMGKPQLVAPKGSISASKITNEIALVVEYRPGMTPPQPMNLLQLPTYIFEEQNQILVDMEDISGQHQVSKGSTPPGVTAATAIGFLQEKDDSFLSPTYGSVEYGFQRIGRHTLSHAQQFWNVARTVKVVGEDSVFDITSYDSSELVAGTDVRVEAGSALPQSKSARMALVMDLMTQGLIPPEEGLGMMEIGGVTKIVDTLQVDKRQAMRENLAIRKLSDEQIDKFDITWRELMGAKDPSTIDPETGQQLMAPPVIPVNTWDNHEIHVEIHNRYRKSQQFSGLSERIKVAFETHVMHHQQVLQQDMLQQVMSNIPSDGTDSGAPDEQNPLGAIMPGSEIQEAPEGISQEGVV